MASSPANTKKAKLSEANAAKDDPAIVAGNDGASETRAGTSKGFRLTSDKLKRALYIIWIIVGVCILTGVFVFLLNILSLPISMLIWTLIIVFILRGIVASLENRGMSRLAGTTIAYVIFFVVLGGILFLMFSPMFGLNNQFADLISNAPGYINSVIEWGKGIADKYSSIMDNGAIKGLLNGIVGSISNWASGLASHAADAAIGIGTGIANTLYAVGFAFVIAFWVLLELPAMGREIKRVLPPKRMDEAHFFHLTFTHILGGYLRGTLIQCFIIGIACGILFAIVGINNAPALGVITGVLNIIPIIGPWLGGAAAAITAVFVSPLTAVIALIGVIVIQQIVYTFISPRIMSNSVDIHPAMTLIAMTFGSAIGGAMSGLMGSLVGLLFAIPFVAVMKSIFIFYFERATGRQIVSTEGFIFKGKAASSGKVDPLYDATSGNAYSDPESFAKDVATLQKDAKALKDDAKSNGEHVEEHLKSVEEHLKKIESRIQETKARIHERSAESSDESEDASAPKADSDAADSDGSTQ